MSEPVEPNSKGIPTAEQIKLYWDADPKRTQRRIAKAMRADGWRIGESSVIRCVNSGFAPRAIELGKRAAVVRHSTPKKITTPEQAAVQQVQAVAPDDAHPQAIAEALVEAIRNLPQGQKDRVQELLEMDDNELVKKTSKVVAVARHLLAVDLARHTKMMMLAPDKAAKLFTALGSSLQPIISPPKPPEPPPAGNGDGARVIEGEVQVLSPSAKAIANFRAKIGSAAA